MRMLTKKFWVMLLTLFACCACEKEIDKYYERPDFLKGNAYELLAGRGNFSYFLKAADLTDMAKVLKGKGLCTVMAPNDEAFKAWLQKNNYSSLADVPIDKLTTLVAYHVLQNSYEEDYLLGFYMAAEYGVKGDGSAYKFKTYSTGTPTSMIDPILGTKINVQDRQKFLPVISTRLFETNKCTNFMDNYKYFFPEVNWQGDTEKLHVGNAAVIEMAIPSDNGYVYVLDKVVDPLRNLYQAIGDQSNSDFSVFLKLYDHFAEVSVASSVDGDTLYNYNHLRNNSKAKTMQYTEQLPNLCSEWAYHGELNGAAPYYSKYMAYTYNCLTPTNAALEDFFRKFFTGFPNIEDVPQLTLYYLLKSHVKEQQNILLPEVMEKNGIKGEFGEKWNITRTNILKHEFCANGIFYGIDQVLAPTVFDIVTKPLFSTPDYAIMANLFYKVDEFVTLTDPTPDRYTLFIVADTALTNQNGIIFDNGNSYFNDGGEKITKAGTAMAVDAMTLLAETHIINGAIRDFNKRVFYAAKNPFSYVYTEDGLLHGENGSAVTIEKTWETVNGPTYQISSLLNKNILGSIDKLKDSYKDFYDLLYKAGIIATNSSSKKDYFTNMTTGERPIIFAPKNGTLDKTALNAMPKADLAAYLSYFIISLDVNAMNDYILPNYGTPQIFKTLQEDKEKTTIYQKVYTELNVGFSGNSLSLTNQAGTKTILTDGEIPFFATDGLIYCITDAIQPK